MTKRAFFYTVLSSFGPFSHSVPLPIPIMAHDREASARHKCEEAHGEEERHEGENELILGHPGANGLSTWELGRRNLKLTRNLPITISQTNFNNSAKSS